MLKQEEMVLLRIFVGESDRFQKQPLYEALIELFRDQGVAGASEDDAAVVLEEALHRRLPLQRQQVMDWIRSQPEGC